MDVARIRFGLIAALCVSTGFGSRLSPTAEPPTGTDPEEVAATVEELAEVPDVRIPFYAPLERLSVYLDGFHFTSGAPEDQIEAHHYCSWLSPDLMQCVMFDSYEPDARLIGVEYVISARLFRSLPDEEKRLWHSHAHEVKSGELLAPALSADEEADFMAAYAATYGKTFHTWHTSREQQLPLGPPALMMDFTGYGQIHPHLLEARDQRFGLSSTAKRLERRGLRTPAPERGADAWKQGDAPQLIVVEPAVDSTAASGR